jgi:hypothetical protein
MDTFSQAQKVSIDAHTFKLFERVSEEPPQGRFFPEKETNGVTGAFVMLGRRGPQHYN